MTAYKPLVIIDGAVQQLDESDSLEVTSIDAGTLSLTGAISIDSGNITSNAGTIDLDDENLVTTGNVSSNSINLSGHLTDYAGSPSNDDVLTWVTANSRAEFKEPSGGGGSGASITSNTTYYLSPTGNDTTGDGSSTSPWATIGKAYSELSDEIIADDVEVTIQLEDGDYEFTETVNVTHANSDKIKITGNNTFDIELTEVADISGTAPNRSVVLGVNDTGNCSVGDILRLYVRYEGSSSTSIHVSGGSQITSVNSSNSTITCNYFKQQTSSRDDTESTASGDITVFKTNVTFNGCDGFTTYGSVINIDKIGFDGVDRTANLLTAYNDGAIFCGGDISIIRFNRGAYAKGGGLLKVEKAGFGCCGEAIYTEDRGKVFANSVAITGSETVGVYCLYGTFVDVSDSIIIGNGSHGIVTSGAETITSNAEIASNTSHGMIIQRGSTCNSQDSWLAWNSSRAILCQHGSFIDVAGGSMASNGGEGLYITGSSSGFAHNSFIGYNSGGLICANDSSCSTSGANISNNTGYNRSPSSGVGNTESFIY